MSKKNDGGPAFPIASYDHQTFNPRTVEESKRLLSGMSLRAYVATKALQGLLANAHLSRSVMKEKASEREANNLHAWHASTACQFADALIVELERDQ